jgi:hypothetical protein
MAGEGRFELTHVDLRRKRFAIKKLRDTPHLDSLPIAPCLAHGFQKTDEAIAAKRAHWEVLPWRWPLDQARRPRPEFSSLDACGSHLSLAWVSRRRIGAPFRKQGANGSVELPVTWERQRDAGEFAQPFRFTPI